MAWPTFTSSPCRQCYQHKSCFCQQTGQNANHRKGKHIPMPFMPSVTISARFTLMVKSKTDHKGQDRKKRSSTNPDIPGSTAVLPCKGRIPLAKNRTNGHRHVFLLEPVCWLPLFFACPFQIFLLSARQNPMLPQPSLLCSISLTAVASCLSEKGFARKAKAAPSSGRFLAKASCA